MNAHRIGLTGKYYVLAQLTHRGFTIEPDLSDTRKNDLSVINKDTNQQFTVKVKTTTTEPQRETLFGDEPFYAWVMKSEHEGIRGDFINYCFVVLGEVDQLPKFFLVPSHSVAEYVRWQHELWLSERDVKPTPIRKFRIPISDPNKYRDNWSIFSE